MEEQQRRAKERAKTARSTSPTRAERAGGGVSRRDVHRVRMRPSPRAAGPTWPGNGVIALDRTPFM